MTQGLCLNTGMNVDDVVLILDTENILVYDSESESHALRVDRDYLTQYVDSKKTTPLIPENLRWTPFLVSDISALATPNLSSDIKRVVDIKGNEPSVVAEAGGVDELEGFGKIGSKEIT